MAQEPPTVRKTLEQVVKELGRYPIDAFEFLNCALDYTVQKTHGPMEPEIGTLLEWLETEGVDPADLGQLTQEGKIPPAIQALVESLGGLEAACERPNRHVSGEELCWGVRDLARSRWGLMASTVLRHWGIRRTRDFGNMVFALVDNQLLAKQPEDRIDDFDGIYDFDTELDQSYKISLRKTQTSSAEKE